jgi:hypothetical protein
VVDALCGVGQGHLELLLGMNRWGWSNEGLDCGKGRDKLFLNVIHRGLLRGCAAAVSLIKRETILARKFQMVKKREMLFERSIQREVREYGHKK